LFLPAVKGRRIAVVVWNGGGLIAGSERLI
jgi:hypothetical protein